MSIKIKENIAIEYSCNGKILTFNKPLVMAIVNLTPDSFYDGGKYGEVEDVLRDVEEKILQGADIIDVGAYSTRPNAAELNEEEEWARLKNALPMLRKKFPKVFISVDTHRAEVMKRSADEGADILNDISGGNFDKDVFNVVAKLNLPYVLMHIQGNPKTMQQNPVYQNVVSEVRDELQAKTTVLKNLGFEKIILDPGFGFGKTVEQNYQLLKHLHVLTDTGFPVLSGVSRKSMINKVIHTNPVTSLNGTTVLNTIALLNGAKILRVHDVTEAKQAIELVEFYEKA